MPMFNGMAGMKPVTYY